MVFFTHDKYTQIVQKIKKKLKSGCNSDFIDKPRSPYPPILIAALYDKEYNVVEELIYLGANINNADFSNIPLSIIIDHRNYDFAKKLIALGANVNTIKTSGFSVIVQMTNMLNKSQDDEMFWDELLKAGADINTAHSRTGNTALHYVITTTHRDALPGIYVKYVKKLGANINSLNAYGETPLDLRFATLHLTYNTHGYDVGELIALGAKYTGIHTEFKLRDIPYLMNKNTILYILVTKSKKGMSVLCQLPVELIQMLHSVLCGNKKINKHMWRGYLDAKASI